MLQYSTKKKKNIPFIVTDIIYFIVYKLTNNYIGFSSPLKYCQFAEIARLRKIILQFF